MKKYLFYLFMITGFTVVNAQTIIWSDNFDDEDLSDWVIYDEDGDGSTWGDYFAITDDEGNPVTPVSLISRSWENVPLTPDNWVVSPAIDLSSVAGVITLKWKVQAASASWDMENYSVYVATASDLVSLGASTVTFTEIYDDPTDAGTQYERSLDISSFAGETVYIAFRHHDVTDMDYLSIDDVSVEGEEGGGSGYCIPDPMNCNDADIILNVTFAGINNDSECSPDGYGDYTSTVAPAEVMAGETYEISMDIGAGFHEAVSLWIDFDNSMTFDADERFDVVDGITGGVFTNEITIPADVADGTYRMRFKLAATGGPIYPIGPCSDVAEVEDTTFGEYEDYLITVGKGGGSDYCIPDPLNCNEGDVIFNVTFAGINNDSECSSDGYGDYTSIVAPAEVVAGETYEISMEIGNGWYEKVSMWIDFNNNMIFDADERFDVVEGDTGGVFTNDITIPADVTDGTYRMRFKLSSTGGDNPYPIGPCNDADVDDAVFGEYEDYLITVGEGGGAGEECTQEVESNNLESALFLVGANNQRLAIDITVEDNTEFTLKTVEPTIIVPEGGEATSFNFIFYEDLGGVPGTQIGESAGTIVSSTVTGQNFGRDFIRYEVSLATPITMETGTYWMEMESDAEGWEATTADVLGSTLVFNNASSSGEWVNDGEGIELVYKIIGTCELSVSDMESFDFAYYPNPVKDELNITSQKVVQSVSIYNLAGQQQVSTQKLNVTNGKVSTRSLAPGVYIFRALLEGGQIETFKVIKR